MNSEVSFAMDGTFAVSSFAGTSAVSPSVAPAITGAVAADLADRGATVLQTDSIIVRALHDADKFHRGQPRHGGRSQIEHVVRIVGRVMLFSDVGVPEITGTAWHDVAEMCCRDVQAQESIFRLHCDRYGPESEAVMRGLTNVSTFSSQPRIKRKAADFAALATQPERVKRIKAVDRIDNLVEAISNLHAGSGSSPRFALLYASESDALALALAGIDPDLMTELKAATADLRRVATAIFESQI